MIEIRTFRSKRNGLRVDLYRRYKHVDTVTNKAKFSYKQVGSFSLKKGYTAELLEKLQPDELVQLQNWLAETKFAEQFQVEADGVAKIPLRMPSPLYDALLRLHIECKRVGINFLAHEVMLNSLLDKARLLQQKLDKINGFNSGILESIGINVYPEKIKGDENSHGEDEESRQLFKALLKLPQPIGKTCSELEEAAKKYGKEKRFPPPQLREWAGDMPTRDPNKRIRKWAYALAIDVLLKNGVHPFTLVSPEKIAHHWAYANQPHYTLEQAKTVFAQLFHPPENIKKNLEEVLENLYKKI